MLITGGTVVTPTGAIAPTSWSTARRSPPVRARRRRPATGAGRP